MSRQAVSVPVGSVTKWLSGGTPDRANAAYWAGSVPWISAATLKKTRIYDSDQRITESAIRAGSKLAPQGATLVLVRGMALHREVRAGLAMRPVSFNQDVKALIPRPGLVPLYLTYSLHAHRARILELVSSAGSGTGVLDTGLLKRLPIWLPDTHEQERIVEAIEDADTAMEALERLIAKKQAIKQGMMQQLLTGRTRLPGYRGNWAWQRLASVLDKLEAGVSVNSISGPGPYSVLKTSCVSGGTFDPSECKTVAPSDLKKVKASPQADSLTISRMNTPTLVGEVGYIETNWPTLFLPDRLWLATKRSPHLVDMRWLGYVLSSRQYREQLREIATGTSGSMKNISRGSFLQLSVPSPPVEEQIAIARALLDVDVEIRALRARLDKARDIKQGMMQQLLTGRTRLPVSGDAS
jgi:type I restriction enzyme S subunit